MLALATLFVAVTVSLLITRIATVALTATGLTREAARFQSRSAFTGVGFTTTQAERVVGHPIRRRIVMALMLFGNIGVVTIAATLILSFVNSPSPTRSLLRLSLLLAGVLALLALSKNKKVDRWLTHHIAKALRRFTEIEHLDHHELLHLAGDYSVAELQVRQRDWLAGKTLAESRLRSEGVAVLGIVHEDGAYDGVPHGDAMLKPGTTLIVYGRTPLLAELDDRPTGPDGDAAHERAVEFHVRSHR
jgi:hypothetical protein